MVKQPNKADSSLRRSVIAASGFALAAAAAAPAAFAAPATYQTAVTADSPYVYYRFNEDPSVATTAADSSGNGRTGTYVGTPTSTTGAGTASDNAVALNGSTQWLDSTATGFATVMATSSYEFVFKTNASYSSSTPQALFGSLNTGSTAAVTVTLNNNASGTTTANAVRLFLRNDAGSSNGFAFTPSTPLFDGNYHDLTFTYSAGNATAYVDGVAQTIAKQNGNSPGNSAAAFTNDPLFGAANNRGTALNPANVTLDEAALYDSALSAAQVATHAATLAPEPAAAGLLGVGMAGLLLRRRRPAA